MYEFTFDFFTQLELYMYKQFPSEFTYSSSNNRKPHQRDHQKSKRSKTIHFLFIRMHNMTRKYQYQLKNICTIFPNIQHEPGNLIHNLVISK